MLLFCPIFGEEWAAGFTTQPSFLPSATRSTLLDPLSKFSPQLLNSYSTQLFLCHQLQNPSLCHHSSLHFLDSYSPLLFTCHQIHHASLRGWNQPNFPVFSIYSLYCLLHQQMCSFSFFIFPSSFLFYSIYFFYTSLIFTARICLISLTKLALFTINGFLSLISFSRPLSFLSLCLCFRSFLAAMSFYVFAWLIACALYTKSTLCSKTALSTKNVK